MTRQVGPSLLLLRRRRRLLRLRLRRRRRKCVCRRLAAGADAQTRTIVLCRGGVLHHLPLPFGQRRLRRWRCAALLWRRPRRLRLLLGRLVGQRRGWLRGWLRPNAVDRLVHVGVVVPCGHEGPDLVVVLRAYVLLRAAMGGGRGGAASVLACVLHAVCEGVCECVTRGGTCGVTGGHAMTRPPHKPIRVAPPPTRVHKHARPPTRALTNTLLVVDVEGRERGGGGRKQFAKGRVCVCVCGTTRADFTAHLLDLLVV